MNLRPVPIFYFRKIFFFQKFITFVPDTLPPCPIGSKQRLYFIFHRIKTVTWQYVRKKSYDFLKIRLIHKNGVNLENHVNQPIFKKSKTRQKTHKFENHLTSCHTNILKIDLDWSNLNFRIFKSPPASPLCITKIQNQLKNQKFHAGGLRTIDLKLLIKMEKKQITLGLG